MRLRIPDGIRHRLEYAALRILMSAIQLLTLRQIERFSRSLAWLVTDVVRFRQRVIYENLKGVYPDLDDLQCRQFAREMWYHLIRMVCEVVIAPRKIHATNWRKFVNIVDEARMTERLIDYRPLVAVTGHYGNFEMGGYVTGLLGINSYTVARPLDNPYLNDFINEFRALHGQFVFPKDGSAHLVQGILSEGGILAFLGDQHAGTKGCWVDFLGRPAACHKAVALFTLDGRAPMMVSYCKQVGGPLQFEIGCTGIADPLALDDSLRDVKSLTQWYNDRLADFIHRDPAQFWWVHRRWKDKPVRHKASTRSAAA